MRRNKWIKSEGNGGAEIFKWKLKYPIQILFFFPVHLDVSDAANSGINGFR